MGLFTPAEYKIGRRFHNDNDQIIEITGRKKDGSYIYSIVNPKTGYLMKGFGGTIAAPKTENPTNPTAQIVDNEADTMQDDPNDDIISVNEYNDATREEGDEPVTPYEDKETQINTGLERAGRVVQALGKVAIVTGTVGGMSLGFILGPFAGFGIAMVGMFTFLGSDSLGNWMRKKAGVLYKKIYTR